jgi:cation diffusion facilitator family transporter
MEPHNHVFLGAGHEHAEKRTWWVIILCTAMMMLEIVGGLLFGSIALVADGLHMTTHAGALLLAALAYSYARRHATDQRFTFGTGKLGDLAGFTSAIVLAMISLLVAWESISRLVTPEPIAFNQAIPIAVLGLAVNVASAWLLSGGAHHHGHGEQGHGEQGHGQQGHGEHGHGKHAHGKHGHGKHSHAKHRHAAHSDNNMRAAVVHVIADAAVSVLVIAGLLLAKTFGWLWMDPAAGLIGAVVIASWAYGLVRDTGRILMDMNPDVHLTEQLRQEIETDGDRLIDLHVWRLGPGHLAAVMSVATGHPRRAEDYHQRLRHFTALSHVTVEVHSP